MRPRPIRAIVVDDHASIAGAWFACCKRGGTSKIVGEASSAVCGDRLTAELRHDVGSWM